METQETKTDTTLDAPKLSAKGREAYWTIVAALRRAGLAYTGGCRAFYSPVEWAARREEYGLKSELIIVYDGGDVGEACRLDGAIYEEVRLELKAIGLYIEECTGWYAAVYPC